MFYLAAPPDAEPDADEAAHREEPPRPQLRAGRLRRPRPLPAQEGPAGATELPASAPAGCGGEPDHAAQSPGGRGARQAHGVGGPHTYSH